MLKDNNEFHFTDYWNKNVHMYWKNIIDKNNYKKLLEIGTHEGNSLYYFLEFGIEEAVCIDLWKNKIYKENFLHNKKLFIEKYNANIEDIEGHSWKELGKIINSDNVLFDLIYVDASHFPHNTLIDACMSFRLLKVGGCIIFDDYIWERKKFGNKDLTPKLAIDCFEKIHYRFIEPTKVYERQKAWYKIKEMEDYG